MKAYRLLKNSLFIRLLGLLMAFLFLSAFTAPEKPDYGIYDPKSLFNRGSSHPNS